MKDVASLRDEVANCFNQNIIQFYEIPLNKDRKLEISDIIIGNVSDLGSDCCFEKEGISGNLQTRGNPTDQEILDIVATSINNLVPSVANVVGLTPVNVLMLSVNILLILKEYNAVSLTERHISC